MDLYSIVVTNPDSKKGFFRALQKESWICIESWLKKILFESLITNPVNFQRFACFHKSNESLWILSTIAQNKSIKIQIPESKSLQILKVWTRKSGFASPNLNDSYRGFNSLTVFQKICIVDSIHKAKIFKLVDLLHFGRICLRIRQAFLHLNC
jgi:hypothetical protein